MSRLSGAASTLGRKRGRNATRNIQHVQVHGVPLGLQSKRPRLPGQMTDAEDPNNWTVSVLRGKLEQVGVVIPASLKLKKADLVTLWNSNKAKQVHGGDPPTQNQHGDQQGPPELEREVYDIRDINHVVPSAAGSSETLSVGPLNESQLLVDPQVATRKRNHESDNDILDLKKSVAAIQETLSVLTRGGTPNIPSPYSEATADSRLPSQQRGAEAYTLETAFSPGSTGSRPHQASNCNQPIYSAGVAADSLPNVDVVSPSLRQAIREGKYSPSSYARC